MGGNAKALVVGADAPREPAMLQEACHAHPPHQPACTRTVPTILHRIVDNANRGC
jgi:hypothetical protein